MLHPSYVELIDHVNNVNKEKGEPLINSRYTLVMAVARRARDLVNGSPKMIVNDNGGRMLAQAVAEMEAEKLGIVVVEPDMETADEKEMTDVDLSTSIDEEN